MMAAQVAVAAVVEAAAGNSPGSMKPVEKLPKHVSGSIIHALTGFHDHAR